MRAHSFDLRALLENVTRKYGRPLYFPFELSSKRDLRPLQGYIFKLPREFVAMFPQLDGANDSPLQRAASQAAEEALFVARQRAYGQGFSTSRESTEAIERYAMQAAEKYLTELGYEVNNESKRNPYDLIAKHGTTRLYVEVKGTTTSGEQIILTRNEVDHARDNPSEMVLFVLHSIIVSKGLDGELEATGGVATVIRPWRIDAGTLQPISFTYTLPVLDAKSLNQVSKG
jgi:hypothetical protein